MVSLKINESCCYLASSACRACSRAAPCLPELGLAHSGSAQRLPLPSRVPLEADECAGRTKGCDLPGSHAQRQARQNPIRPVPPLALRSFIQRTHSLLSYWPVSFSSVGGRSVRSGPLGSSKSPGGAWNKALSLPLCVQQEGDGLPSPSTLVYTLKEGRQC